MQEEIDVIINCAAAVDFINTLSNAMRDNFDNTMRILKFAKECKNLQVFVQVSTAYVNSNREGYIEEKLYDFPRGIDETINHIKKLSEHDLEKETDTITKGYPNTYTFSKFLAEHKISQEKGSLSLAIVRPTIIGASYNEPFAGWVDAVTALTGVYFYFGLGITKELYANPKIVLDVVAVDICANMTIAAGVYQANKGTVKIFHSGSSHKNPVMCGELLHLMIKFLTDHPTKAFVDKKVDTKFISNKFLYAFLKLTETLLYFTVMSLRMAPPLPLIFLLMIVGESVFVVVCGFSQNQLSVVE